MIEQNNPTPLETTKLELEDETGYNVEHWLDLGSFFYPSPGFISEEIHYLQQQD